MCCVLHLDLGTSRRHELQAQWNSRCAAPRFNMTRHVVSLPRMLEAATEMSQQPWAAHVAQEGAS